MVTDPKSNLTLHNPRILSCSIKLTQKLLGLPKLDTASHLCLNQTVYYYWHLYSAVNLHSTLYIYAVYCHIIPCPKKLTI